MDNMKPLKRLISSQYNCFLKKNFNGWIMFLSYKIFWESFFNGILNEKQQKELIWAFFFLVILRYNLSWDLTYYFRIFFWPILDSSAVRKRRYTISFKKNGTGWEITISCGYTRNEFLIECFFKYNVTKWFIKVNLRVKIQAINF